MQRNPLKQMADPNPLNEAVRRLFIASEMYNWPRHEHLSRSEHPCSDLLSDNLPSFPRPIPSQVLSNRTYAPVPFQLMKTAPLVLSPSRTGVKSTAPAKSIENLHIIDAHLKKIRHCPTMLSRLAWYAMAPGQTFLNIEEYPPDGVVRNRPPEPIASSWTDENTHPDGRASLPPDYQQARTIDRMAASYAFQRSRTPGVVSSELSIQHQVYTQLVDYTNASLRTRYSRSAFDSEPLIGSWEVDEHLPAEETRKDTGLPYWGFSVDRDLPFGVTSSGVPEKGRKAGHPDFMLYVSHNEFPALGEIKPWWVVTPDAVDELFKTTAEDDGMFTWNFDANDMNNVFVRSKFMTPAHRALRQLWGELHVHQSQAAFFGNGRHFLFALKTGDNELTFSNWISWEDPELYLAFTGFTMFASDAALTQSDIPKHKVPKPKARKPKGRKSKDGQVARVDDDEGDSEDEGDGVTLKEYIQNITDKIKLEICPETECRIQRE